MEYKEVKEGGKIPTELVRTLSKEELKNLEERMKNIIETVYKPDFEKWSSFNKGELLLELEELMKEIENRTLEKLGEKFDINPEVLKKVSIIREFGTNRQNEICKYGTNEDLERIYKELSEKHSKLIEKRKSIVNQRISDIMTKFEILKDLEKDPER